MYLGRSSCWMGVTENPGESMKITKTTPIYVYDNIVPAAQFWERSFGFQRIVEVPHEGSPGFILLTNGEREIMFQSVASGMPPARS